MELSSELVQKSILCRGGSCNDSYNWATSDWLSPGINLNRQETIDPRFRSDLSCLCLYKKQFPGKNLFTGLANQGAAKRNNGNRHKLLNANQEAASVTLRVEHFDTLDASRQV